MTVQGLIKVWMEHSMILQKKIKQPSREPENTPGVNDMDYYNINVVLMKGQKNWGSLKVS